MTHLNLTREGGWGGHSLLHKSEKGTGAEICPAIASGIVIWDAPVSYWPIGSLQPAIHVVQNYHAGEQKSHWDKTNKRNT